ncbi:MAG TPA: ChbG/HpnK family deacetylase [Ilumatobacter sp.]
MTRIVIHEDDVAFCRGANDAFIELSRRGTVSSGSAMVPCPWFHDLALRAAGDDRLDLGVHLTLTSEHAGYRWAPITRPSPAAGLTDEHGYMWPSVQQVRRHAAPDAVEEEWRAQLDRALAAGIDVTHLDAHMGAALAPEWCARYVALGVEYAVPALITIDLAAYGPSNHLAGTAEETFAEFVHQARAAGMPVFDSVLETDFRRPRGAPVDYAAMLSAVDPSCDLVYCAFHPCAPGEAELIDTDWWHVRTDEYRIFGEPAWRAWLDAQPFEVIGMRHLRDEFRSHR